MKLWRNFLNFFIDIFFDSYEIWTKIESKVAPRTPSRPTWGIASLRQTTDFTPVYIAERACREELLDLASLTTSPTQV
jgi:hypothetical protein